MSEVKRYQFKGAAGEYVYSKDFDRVTAELQRQLDHKEQQRESELRNCQAGDRLVGALQQRLNAADERADVLVGLLRRVVESSVLSFEQDAPESLESLEADICAALKSTESAKDEHVCSGCGSKGWTANCKECVPY